jgi:hypothetical protein
LDLVSGVKLKAPERAVDPIAQETAVAAVASSPRIVWIGGKLSLPPYAATAWVFARRLLRAPENSKNSRRFACLCRVVRDNEDGVAMQTAQAVHSIPGRLRLKLSGAKGNLHLLNSLRESIQAIPEVTGVEVNPRSGSVLVRYRSREPETFLRDLCERGVKEEFLQVDDASLLRNRSAKRIAITLRRAMLVQGRGSGNVDSASPGVSTRLRKFTGRTLVALGVAGVMLPIIPGLPLLLAGAAVLGPKDPLVARSSALIRKLRAATRRESESQT